MMSTRKQAETSNGVVVLRLSLSVSLCIMSNNNNIIIFLFAIMYTLVVEKVYVVISRDIAHKNQFVFHIIFSRSVL